MTLALPEQFQARARFNEPMSEHNSWHAGGHAEVFYSPRDVEDVAALLRALPPDVPVYWTGLGSNLLVRDGGVRGVIIATPGAFNRIERREDGTVYVEASVPCARIARNCVAWGLGGAEFFGGIPGTFGGALAMNAGAFGAETWMHVVAVETIDRQGERHLRDAADFQAEYRTVRSRVTDNMEWYLSGTLRFGPADDATAKQSAELLRRRRETQPLGLWSCGSVFKNPPGDHAARLIEAAGLKGFRIGNAVVSPKHANFIINEDNATAADLEGVIRHVQATVHKVHGIQLQPEVRIIGEPLAGLEGHS